VAVIPMQPYREAGMEYQPFYNTESRAIMAVESPSDWDLIRRKSIIAQHCSPDAPEFYPEDYS
jgi:hypothetical protein